MNLVLTGFMGTGKTTVGCEVARRLGRTFVDMDDVIVTRAGKAIPRIFAEDGEAAFRAIEAAVCAELSAQDGLVIATGGGALVDAENRRKMLYGAGTEDSSGESEGGVALCGQVRRTSESATHLAGMHLVVCLEAEPDEILRRVRDNIERPLLNVADPRAEIARLLAARREAYTAIPWHIATDGREVDDVVAQTLALAKTITLWVRCPGNIGRGAQSTAGYPIHIGRGLLAHLGGALRAGGGWEGTAVALVTNTVVGPLYAGQVEAVLQGAGYRPFVCTIPDGEQHKTLDTVRTLYDQFLVGQLDRSGIVLALGGGVTGDIAGFAAATFMRGTRFVQVPTSLLAMTDASVGGKTGVDLPQGKNLAGAFKQPELVLIDLDVLDTLPEAEFRSGMAELLKHGVIGAPELVQSPKSKVDSRDFGLSTLDFRPETLARSLQVKIGIVEEDPSEKGRRAVLNLGHTTAHGLEQVSEFTLRHGDAVSIGMVAAARIAEALGRAEPGLASRIAAVLAAWNLPMTCPPYPVDAIWAAMTHDKKKQGKGLRWILPRALGDVEIADDVPEGLVRRILMEMGARE